MNRFAKSIIAASTLPIALINDALSATALSLHNAPPQSPAQLLRELKLMLVFVIQLGAM